MRKVYHSRTYVPKVGQTHHERAGLIEQIVRTKYLGDEDIDAADLALDELGQNENRDDDEIAHVVAMRIAQP